MKTMVTRHPTKERSRRFLINLIKLNLLIIPAILLVLFPSCFAQTIEADVTCLTYCDVIETDPAIDPDTITVCYPNSCSYGCGSGFSDCDGNGECECFGECVGSECYQTPFCKEVGYSCGPSDPDNLPCCFGRCEWMPPGAYICIGTCWPNSGACYSNDVCCSGCCYGSKCMPSYYCL